MPRNLQRALIGAIIALATTASAVAQQGPAVLRLGTFIPPTAPFIKNGLEHWINAVNADAEGTIKIELFAGGSLMKHPDQQLRMVLDNVAQIGFLPNNTAPGQFPDDAVFELPLGPRNAHEASVAAWKLYEKGLLRGYQDVKVLGFLANGPALLQTSFPVKRMEDVAGRKIRTQTEAQIGMIRVLGGTPIGSIPVTAAAESISRRLIDGTVSGWAAWAAFRLDKVATHHVELPMGYAILPLIMNKTVWEGLPPKAKAAVEKHSYLAASTLFGKVDTGVADAVRAKAKEGGGNDIVILADAEEARWRSALTAVIEDWRKSHPNGNALYQALETALAGTRGVR